MEVIWVKENNWAAVHKIDSGDDDSSLDFIDANDLFEEMHLFLDELLCSDWVFEDAFRKDYKNVVIYHLDKGDGLIMLAFENIL